MGFRNDSLAVNEQRFLREFQYGVRGFVLYLRTWSVDCFHREEIIVRNDAAQDLAVAEQCWNREHTSSFFVRAVVCRERIHWKRFEILNRFC